MGEIIDLIWAAVTWVAEHQIMTAIIGGVASVLDAWNGKGLNEVPVSREFLEGFSIGYTVSGICSSIISVQQWFSEQATAKGMEEAAKDTAEKAVGESAKNASEEAAKDAVKNAIDPAKEAVKDEVRKESWLNRTMQRIKKAWKDPEFQTTLKNYGEDVAKSQTGASVGLANVGQGLMSIPNPYTIAAGELATKVALFEPYAKATWVLGKAYIKAYTGVN